jgi:hypothetical protein
LLADEIPNMIIWDLVKSYYKKMNVNDKTWKLL